MRASRRKLGGGGGRASGVRWGGRGWGRWRGVAGGGVEGEAVVVWGGGWFVWGGGSLWRRSVSGLVRVSFLEASCFRLQRGDQKEAPGFLAGCGGVCYAVNPAQVLDVAAVWRWEFFHLSSVSKQGLFKPSFNYSKFSQVVWPCLALSLIITLGLFGVAGQAVRIFRQLFSRLP